MIFSVNYFYAAEIAKQVDSTRIFLYCLGTCCICTRGRGSVRGEAGAPAARERRRQLRGVEVRGAAVQQLGHGLPGAEHQVSVLVPGPGAGGVAGAEHLASQARHHARHGAHAAAGEIFRASTLLMSVVMETK